MVEDLVEQPDFSSWMHGKGAVELKGVKPPHDLLVHPGPDNVL